MNKNRKKELLQDIDTFLNSLTYYIDDCGEDKKTIEKITQNEITRFFKNRGDI